VPRVPDRQHQNPCHKIVQLEIAEDWSDLG
jgi:hypothetical protein